MATGMYDDEILDELKVIKKLLLAILAEGTEEMTLKDYATIQRHLGYIEGAALQLNGNSINKVLLAVSKINDIILRGIDEDERDDEYIKRSDALNAILSEHPDAHYPDYYAEKIARIPAADVAPVQNEWISVKESTEWLD